MSYSDLTDFDIPDNIGKAIIEQLKKPVVNSEKPPEASP